MPGAADFALLAAALRERDQTRRRSEVVTKGLGRLVMFMAGERVREMILAGDQLPFMCEVNLGTLTGLPPVLLEGGRPDEILTKYTVVRVLFFLFQTRTEPPRPEECTCAGSRDAFDISEGRLAWIVASELSGAEDGVAGCFWRGNEPNRDSVVI